MSRLISAPSERYVGRPCFRPKWCNRCHPAYSTSGSFLLMLFSMASCRSGWESYNVPERQTRPPCREHEICNLCSPLITATFKRCDVQCKYKANMCCLVIRVAAPHLFARHLSAPFNGCSTDRTSTLDPTHSC